MTMRALMRVPSVMMVREAVGIGGGGGWTRGRRMYETEAIEEEEKVVTVEATIILQGFDVSELKSVLPLVDQHLNVVLAKKAIYKQFDSISPTLPVYKEVLVGYHKNVSFQGYEDSELETLPPPPPPPAAADPKATPNLNILLDYNTSYKGLQ